MRNESWLRLMSGLVLVGVFAAGALFGAGLLRWTAPSESRLPPLPPRGGPIEAIKRELALDADQIAALDAIAKEKGAELETIGREMQQRVRGIVLSIEDALVPKLRPDQVAKLNEWRKTRRPPHPPGLGPPGLGPPGFGRGGPPGGPPPGGPPGGP
jgi:hypothetical protein